MDSDIKLEGNKLILEGDYTEVHSASGLRVDLVAPMKGAGVLFSMSDLSLASMDRRNPHHMGGPRRALVHDFNDGLTINYAADYPGGVTVGASGNDWDIRATEGDFRIGNDQFRLKIGVSTGGGGAGDVRIGAQGGTNRLMLGGGGTDVVTVTPTGAIVAGTLVVRSLDQVVGQNEQGGPAVSEEIVDHDIVALINSLRDEVATLKLQVQQLKNKVGL